MSSCIVEKTLKWYAWNMCYFDNACTKDISILQIDSVWLKNMSLIFKGSIVNVGWGFDRKKKKLAFGIVSFCYTQLWTSFWLLTRQGGSYVKWPWEMTWIVEKTVFGPCIKPLTQSTTGQSVGTLQLHKATKQIGHLTIINHGHYHAMPCCPYRQVSSPWT